MQQTCPYSVTLTSTPAVWNTGVLKASETRCFSDLMERHHQDLMQLFSQRQSYASRPGRQTLRQKINEVVHLFIFLHMCSCLLAADYTLRLHV